MPAAQINTPDNYVFGRPAKHNLKELADHLLEWVEDDRHYDLLKWLAEKKLDPRLPSQWVHIDPYFGEAWYTAKIILAARRNEMATIGEIPNFIWSRYVHNYDVLHHLEDEIIKDKDAIRKKDIEGAKTSAVTVKVSHDGLGAGLNISTAPVSNPTD